MSKKDKKIILCILDGWGHTTITKNNAISLAKTNTYDTLLNEYPNSLLKTSGPNVGLPEGQMGNSEVGHLNLGSGRIIKQDLVRIDEAINDKNLVKNEAIKDLSPLGKKEIYVSIKKRNICFV